MINTAKRSRQALTYELRSCIARSPIEEFFAANQAGGSQDSVIKRTQKTSWERAMGVRSLTAEGAEFHAEVAGKSVLRIPLQNLCVLCG